MHNFHLDSIALDPAWWLGDYADTASTPPFLSAEIKERGLSVETRDMDRGVLQYVKRIKYLDNVSVEDDRGLREEHRWVGT